MGKTTKLHLGKTRQLSAFAAYSREGISTNAKRGRVESASSIQDPVATYAPFNSTDLEKASESKVSTTSSSFIKHISNKAALSLKRGSMKRKKKPKKMLEDAPSTHWRPSCIPTDACGKSPMVNFSTLQNPPFNGKSQSVPKPTQVGKKLLDIVELKEEKSKEPNNILYKEDRSIELSTSQSLNGCEDDDEAEEGKEIKKSEGVTMDLVLTNTDKDIPPPKKRVRVANQDFATFPPASNSNSSLKPADSKRNDQQMPDKTKVIDEIQLHGKDVKNCAAKKASSSFTTVSKKASSIPKMPFPEGDSEEDGRLLFEWLIQPFTSKKFFSNIWEKKPLLVRRHIANYAEGLFSSSELNRILMECNIRFGVNLDVTTYQNGVRETHNVEGRAFAPVVWDYYKNDCSVRIKNPQAFSKPVWKLCCTLQEYFKSMVGANIYLTPPGTQGFAPHYDDIEAFVLQLEGKKQWSLYNPRNGEETLPRYSSGNFDPDEIGTEILSTTLEPGDLLYFPRGFIHQAKSLPDTHSLHITISTYQKNSWGDLLEKLVPMSLEKAIADDVEFRKGLPHDLLSCLGVQNSDKDVPRRKEILGQVANMFRKLADYADADAAADQRGVEFLHSALPPVFTQDEKSRSVQGADVRMTSPGYPSACLCGIDATTNIRIMRKNAVRLCVNAETDANDNVGVRVYHSVQNSRVYHEEERKFFEMESECAPALEYLIHSYPKYVSVDSLPLQSDDDKINLASSLFEKGILVTERKVKMLTETL